MDTLSPRQFANSMHRRREALVFRFPRSLANLHGFFFLLFSPYPHPPLLLNSPPLVQARLPLLLTRAVSRLKDLFAL